MEWKKIIFSWKLIFLTLRVFHYLGHKGQSLFFCLFVFFNQHETTKQSLLFIAALLVLLIKAKYDSDTQTNG